GLVAEGLRAARKGRCEAGPDTARAVNLADHLGELPKGGERQHDGADMEREQPLFDLLHALALGDDRPAGIGAEAVCGTSGAD
ncbi:hypothetical protein, partial [Priestia megaterium]|uniref:hypothetical protein n=1 Tax=Priestia megaterium TaxID=1404 RepID=UPI0035B621B0